MAKLWQKAGSGSGLHPDVEAFLSSLPVDSRLFPEDLECSIAHASMLGEMGILPEAEATAIAAELGKMLAEFEAGSLAVDPDSEDIHSFIEAELTKRLGEAGKAVHAGRSRNDQVAVAFRLHILRAFASTQGLLLDALNAVLALAKNHTGTIMPGYTHLQRAQPVTLAHHLLAWAAALERDASRLADGGKRADECPLGSGALAGSGLPTDREATAKALGFARPSRNTMDAVADRDACVDYAAACSIIAMHLSRACEDIVLWTSTEYAFMGLTDAASTGSSIMPQKRNPDPAELIRGKSARIFGGLQALLVLQKGLPYAYDRDLQEDKELFFDLEDTISGCLKAFAVLVSSLVPDVETLRDSVKEGFLEATDVAEYLVLEGIPFRTAYQASKELVSLCIASGKRLPDLGPSEIAAAHPAFAGPGFDVPGFKAYLDPVACVARRDQAGGPAPRRTKEELARLERFIAEAQTGLGRGRKG
ncbi:MAG: argininosuccinate lyase [Spirochaetes bacterium]|nr:argininosuccinate lyase [Spirochaetota bacterium]